MKKETLKRNWILHYIKPEFLYLPRKSTPPVPPSKDGHVVRLHFRFTYDGVNYKEEKYSLRNHERYKTIYGVYNSNNELIFCNWYRMHREGQEKELWPYFSSSSFNLIIQKVPYIETDYNTSSIYHSYLILPYGEYKLKIFQYSIGECSAIKSDEYTFVVENDGQTDTIQDVYIDMFTEDYVQAAFEVDGKWLPYSDLCTVSITPHPTSETPDPPSQKGQNLTTSQLRNFLNDNNAYASYVELEYDSVLVYTISQSVKYYHRFLEEKELLGSRQIKGYSNSDLTETLIPYQQEFSYTQSTIDKVYYERERRWIPSDRGIVSRCCKKINNDSYRAVLEWGSHPVARLGLGGGAIYTVSNWDFHVEVLEDLEDFHAETSRVFVSSESISPAIQIDNPVNVSTFTYSYNYKDKEYSTWADEHLYVATDQLTPEQAREQVISYLPEALERIYKTTQTKTVTVPYGLRKGKNCMKCVANLEIPDEQWEDSEYYVEPGSPPPKHASDRIVYYTVSFPPKLTNLSDYEQNGGLNFEYPIEADNTRSMICLRREKIIDLTQIPVWVQ